MIITQQVITEYNLQPQESIDNQNYYYAWV